MSACAMKSRRPPCGGSPVMALSGRAASRRGPRVGAGVGPGVRPGRARVPRRRDDRGGVARRRLASDGSKRVRLWNVQSDQACSLFVCSALATSPSHLAPACSPVMQGAGFHAGRCSQRHRTHLASGHRIAAARARQRGERPGTAGRRVHPPGFPPTIPPRLPLPQQRHQSWRARQASDHWPAPSRTEHAWPSGSSG